MNKETENVTTKTEGLTDTPQQLFRIAAQKASEAGWLAIAVDDAVWLFKRDRVEEMLRERLPRQGQNPDDWQYHVSSDIGSAVLKILRDDEDANMVACGLDGWVNW